MEDMSAWRLPLVVHHAFETNGALTGSLTCRPRGKHFSSPLLALSHDHRANQKNGHGQHHRDDRGDHHASHEAHRSVPSPPLGENNGNVGKRRRRTRRALDTSGRALVWFHAHQLVWVSQGRNNEHGRPMDDAKEELLVGTALLSFPSTATSQQSYSNGRAAPLKSRRSIGQHVLYCAHCWIQWRWNTWPHGMASRVAVDRPSRQIAQTRSFGSDALAHGVSSSCCCCWRRRRNALTSKAWICVCCMRLASSMRRRFSCGSWTGRSSPCRRRFRLCKARSTATIVSTTMRFVSIFSTQPSVRTDVAFSITAAAALLVISMVTGRSVAELTTLTPSTN